MRLLLDTHVILWWLQGDRTQLGEHVIELISTEQIVYFSPISTYEIALKAAKGKLRLPENFSAGLDEFSELPIRDSHTRFAAALPAIHADPFDRILIAQAAIERLTLVTRDTAILHYDGDTLEV
jgi:PIN domain nuclease of toxin-antitoxin system